MTATKARARPPPAPNTIAHPRRVRLIAVVILLAAGAVSWLSIQAYKARDQVVEITATVQEFQGALGYTGLIHHFKNAVLRPDEPHYIALAIDDYGRAVVALERLKDIAEETGETVDIQPILDTLELYAEAISVVAESHAAGLGIAEVDALVRIPDADADIAILKLELAMVAVVEGQAARTLLLRWIAIAGLAAATVALMLELRSNATIMTQWADLVASNARIEREDAQNDRLQQAIGQLDQSHREMSEFTYALSHDLKAPTLTAKTLVEVLREILGPKPTTEASETMDDLESVLGRMSLIIEDITAYTQAVRVSPGHALVDLDAVLDDVLGDLRTEIDASGARITRDVLPSVRGDAKQLSRLLQHLVTNALKYRAENRPPTIRIGPRPASNGQVSFAVQDNGLGIDPAHRDKVFGLFTRLHNQDSIPGTGLGLPICRHIAQAHGGDIRIGDDTAIGTAFVVTLDAA